MNKTKSVIARVIHGEHNNMGIRKAGGERDKNDGRHILEGRVVLMQQRI